MMKLCLLACRVLWREFSRFASDSAHEIHYRFLPQGLHVDPDRLRSELQAGLDQAEKEGFDRILVGYGLCCLGTAGLRTRETPWVIPRAHDCITFLLGSKERYQDYFNRHPHTYWYSPGWIETGAQPSGRRLQESFADYRDRFGEDNARYLMEQLEGWVQDYRRAAYVDLGVGGREAGLAYTRRCAEELGWEMEVLEGDSGLIQRFLNGPWNEAEFLEVPPGRTIRASGDERVMGLTEEGQINGVRVRAPAPLEKEEKSNVQEDQKLVDAGGIAGGDVLLRRTAKGL